MDQKFTLIEKDSDLLKLLDKWESENINLIAMDFEGEFNLHVYGEHLCLIQLYDKKNYYVVDALKISKISLKILLESDIEKIMFDCSSDSTLVRREFGIILKNIYDIRVLAKAVDYFGNLAGLIERNLKVINKDSNKKKNQKSNWIKRPLKEDQLIYALGDVQYLYALKSSLEKEIENLPQKDKKDIAYNLSVCAKPKHKDTLEWERLCNRRMNKRTKLYLKEYWTARDNIARKRNQPASFIIPKKILVDMAFEEDYHRINRLKKNELNEFVQAEDRIQKALKLASNY